MTRNLRVDWLYDPQSRFHLPSQSIRETLWMTAFALCWTAAELLRSIRLDGVAGGFDSASYWAHRRRMAVRDDDSDSDHDQG